MSRVLIVAEKEDSVKELYAALKERGFACSVTADAGAVVKQGEGRVPDLVLVAMNGRADPGVGELCHQLKREKVPVMGLIAPGGLDTLDVNLWDDFAIQPSNLEELVLRVRRILRRNNHDELITCGDLVIDLAKCEVSIAAKTVMLTFREYELLKFLATNRGRVFSRTALLDRVWGYDYFGGDRTVDVHIRRLRSKIEDSHHTFIDTLRNIGYRFRES